MEFIKKLLKKETLSYLLFGVLTTAVNYVVFFLFYNALSLQELIANAIAFVVAVIFSYVMNKVFVFHSKHLSLNQLLLEFCSFVGARLLTFALEQLGLWISGLLKLDTVTVLTVFSVAIDGIMVAKIALSVIVVIVNFFLCKFVIFRKGNKVAKAVKQAKEIDNA